MTPVCQAATETARPGWLSPRRQIVLAVCACASASAFLYAVDPSHSGVYPQCLLYKLTGVYCAGCGATRALHALLHGRVLDALHDNALLVATLPLFLAVIGSHALTAWQHDAWPRVNVEERTLVRRGLGFLLLLLGFMALRNLPGWPFDWLKPLVG